MKKLLLLCAIALCTQQAFAQAGITVYDGPNYTGKAQVLEPGNHDMNVLSAGIGNDKLASVKIPQGYEVMLYENHSFAGRQARFATSVSSFAGGSSFKVSSIRVGRAKSGPCGSPSAREEQSPTLKAFSQSFKICSSFPSKLEKIDFMLKSTPRYVPATLKIYKGEAQTPDALLHSQPMGIAASKASQQVSVPITDFAQQLQPGETYTFAVEAASGMLLQPKANYSNPYPDGKGDGRADWDFWFTIQTN